MASWTKPRAAAPARLPNPTVNNFRRVLQMLTPLVQKLLRYAPQRGQESGLDWLICAIFARQRDGRNRASPRPPGSPKVDKCRFYHLKLMVLVKMATFLVKMATCGFDQHR